MEPRVLRVGGYAPEGSVHTRAIQHFADYVHGKSNGEVTVELVPNVMDLGKPADALIDMVETGELTWCYFSSSYFGASVPAMEALEVPFAFGSLAEAHAALDGELGRVLSDAVAHERGLDVLGFWDNGFRHLTNAVRPIRTPEDCAGLSIRLQPNAVHEALAASWGMNPHGMELSEGIAMITSGGVDAQENPLANTVAYGVEHAHFTMSSHLYGARGLFAAEQTLETLGTDIVGLVRSGARSAIEFQRSAAEAYEADLRTRLEAEGRQFVDLTVAERTAFASAAAQVIDRARSALPTAIARLMP